MKKIDKMDLEKDQYAEQRKYGVRGISYLTLEKRKKLEKLLSEKKQIKDISTKLKMSRSTIYYERLRMGSLDIPYDAETAHKQAKNANLLSTRKTDYLPRSHKQNISKMYRMIKSLDCEKVSPRIDDALKYCLLLLEKMGANPEKMKRPISVQESGEIINLWKQGFCYSEIEKKLGRSKSSVLSVIQKNQDKLTKPTEEIVYENIKDKWINAIND